MKTLVHPILFFSLCLLAFTARSCIGNDVVHDRDGEAVTSGGQYRILGVGHSRALNPSLFRFYPECVFSLTLQPAANSLPVTISAPHDASSSIISTSSPLSLSYTNHPNAACTNLTLEWFVAGNSLSSAYVLVGPKQDYFVPDVVQEGWFFFKNIPSANLAYSYALVFCTDRKGTDCTNLALRLDAWSRSNILVIDQGSSKPFIVQIQREPSTASGISMVV